MSAGAHCSPLGKMAKITDFLYLGGLAAAKTEHLLKEEGITCVINGKLIHMHVSVKDSVNTRFVSYLFGMPDDSCSFMFRPCLDKLMVFFHFLSLFEASMEAPDVSYESIQCTRIRLEDNPTCNIGIHFDLVADKIGELTTCSLKLTQTNTRSEATSEKKNSYLFFNACPLTGS